MKRTKDEHGNGLDCEEMHELGLMASNYTMKASQSGNKNITIYHEWDFSMVKTPSVLEQLKTLDAWESLEKPQGVHLDVPGAKISWIEKIELYDYYLFLTEELKKLGDDYRGL